MNKEITLEWIEKKAKEVLEVKGSHQPQLMGVKPNGEIVIALLMFRNNEEKEQIRQVTRHLIEKENITHYFTIMESWLSQQDGSMPYVQPSKRVDRKEALVIIEFRKGEKEKGFAQIFSRKGKKIVWGEKNELGESHSIWNFFLEEEGVNERMDKVVKDTNEKYVKQMAKKMSDKFKPQFNEMLAEKDQQKKEELAHKLAEDMFNWAENEKKKLDKKRFEEDE
jgi:hypothetical protein